MIRNVFILNTMGNRYFEKEISCVEYMNIIVTFIAELLRVGLDWAK